MPVAFKPGGNSARYLAERWPAAMADAGRETMARFAETSIAKRFTQEHANEAHYQPRYGADLAFGSREFWASYTGAKYRQFGHMLPFVWSGETRSKALEATELVSDGGTTELRLNLYKIALNPRYVADFTRVTESEQLELRADLQRTLPKRLEA